MNINENGLNIPATNHSQTINEIMNEEELYTFRRMDSKEASDAGILLWRQNLAAFIPFFALPFWIFAFFTRIIFPANLQYLSWLTIWLCKPLFDRLILHVISIRFFDKGADYKRLRKGLIKNITRGLAGDIFWRRFSPLRSVIMPVRVLERNIKISKAVSERKKNLEKGGIGFGFFLTVWGIAAEAALLAGEVLFIRTIFEFLANDLLYAIEGFADIEIWIFAAWCFNFMLVETIYVCMGFSLYINSRIETEGWDMEITFRGFAEKIKNATLIVLVSACLFFPAKTFAQEAEKTAQDIPFETLKTILESPDYGSVEETWGIRFKNQQQQQQREDTEIDSDLIKRLQQTFAYALRFILIIIIAGLLALLIFYLIKMKMSKTGRTDNYSEDIIFNHIDEDPKKLLEKAVNYHKQGEIRLAWGYCAAAAVQSWSLYRGIKFPANATENDCVNIVCEKSDNSMEASAFGRFLKTWVYLAYAGRLPPEGSFEEAVNFCITLGAQNG